MKIQARLRGRPGVGLEIQISKRRGGPEIRLGDEETLPLTDGENALIARLPVDPDDRERAIHSINVDSRFFWGLEVQQ